MTVELKVPVLPESVADATVAQWHKKPGDFVKRDENLVDLETDKVMLEVPAVQDGILEKIVKTEGSKVKAQEVLAIIKAGDAKSATKEATTKEATTKEAAPAKKDEPIKSAAASATSPSVRRMAAEHDVDLSQVKGSGKGERITKDDVSQAIRPKSETQKEAKGVSPEMLGERVEKRVAMSRLRARIAERLVEAQHSAAMLTTFNEVNMKPVMDLRVQYKEQFEKTHGVKLGLMSFFVKAAVETLKRFPVVNASIDGQDIVYHGYYDIGIAVSTERGLVVPILRDVDKMSLAEIEKQIISYSARAREGKISIEEMTGGTFTITNGGVFGSMLSTPIINPPQCAILGMHNIVKRPVVENDQIVVRPMMYVAMSYDHRLIDGRESVSFLLTIKQLIEDPMRLILEV